MRLAARILYAPFGIIAGIVAGLLSKKLFTAVWGQISDEEPPNATTESATTGKVVGAAVLQAAVFAGTRAWVDRRGARIFYYFTGLWPGERKPDDV